MSVRRDGPTNHFLGVTFIVGIGGIDDVDSGVPCGANDAGGDRLVGRPAEHHCAETDWGYFQPASPEFSIFHFNPLQAADPEDFKALSARRARPRNGPLPAAEGLRVLVLSVAEAFQTPVAGLLLGTPMTDRRRRPKSMAASNTGGWWAGSC